MTTQDLFFAGILSSTTLNFVLFYFFVGLGADRLGKGKPRWVGWAILFLGLAIVTLIFRFAGGTETIFG